MLSFNREAFFGSLDLVEGGQFKKAGDLPGADVLPKSFVHLRCGI